MLESLQKICELQTGGQPASSLLHSEAISGLLTFRKVIKYGSSTSVLVRHICTKSCKVDVEVKNKVSSAHKRRSIGIVTPPKDSNKKMKQSVLFPLKPEPTEFPDFEPEEKEMFRSKMLIWDLGVVNRDLRPFNIFDGSGMQARDQAL